MSFIRLIWPKSYVDWAQQNSFLVIVKHDETGYCWSLGRFLARLAQETWAQQQASQQMADLHER
jgi:hypothetical protein